MQTKLSHRPTPKNLSAPSHSAASPKTQNRFTYRCARPNLWRFAAQSLLVFHDRTADALGMMVDAVRALQQERPKDVALEMESNRDFSAEQQLVETIIPRVVERFKCGDDVKMLVRDLERLVSAPKTNPRRRNWKSWLSGRS